MSAFYYDPDEWETYFERGDKSFTCGMRRRDPMEVALIKSEKRRAHEDAVLAEAELIRKGERLASRKAAANTAYRWP